MSPLYWSAVLINSHPHKSRFAQRDTPVHSGHIADADRTIGFLGGGPDLSLKQGAIEDAIGTHTRTETTLFAADLTEAMEHSYCLTLLVT
jgi:hypothetical protein